MPVVPKSSMPTAPAIPAVDPTYLAMAAGQMEAQGRLFEPVVLKNANDNKNPRRLPRITDEKSLNDAINNWAEGDEDLIRIKKSLDARGIDTTRIPSFEGLED